LTGALISYERVSRSLRQTDESQATSTGKKSRNSSPSQEAVSPGLIAGIGLVIGLLVALPPVTADNKWWSALKSRNLELIEASLSPSYFNPSNSQKYAQAINLLLNNNLSDQALKYARASVAFNPEDFTAWLQLYSLQNTPVEEKEIALANLKRLDPRNPDVTKP
jgi:cytochrome c-type biogenesis protein CcmH/NrfG